jgi:trigger factor
VTVNQVAEADLPPVDAEFATQLGVVSGDVEQLRREVRQNVEAEVAKRIKGTIKEQVMDAMYTSAAFEVPRSLLENEIQRMQQQAVEDLKQRGMTQQEITLPPQLFTDRAARRIKVGLVVAELVKRNNLQARPDQVKKIIEEHAQSFEQPEQLIRWYYADPARLAEVEALAMEDNVVEWALGQVGVVDEKMSFDDLMGTKKG